jgi:hypothetical protein
VLAGKFVTAAADIRHPLEHFDANASLGDSVPGFSLFWPCDAAPVRRESARALFRADSAMTAVDSN